MYALLYHHSENQIEGPLGLTRKTVDHGPNISP